MMSRSESHLSYAILGFAVLALIAMVSCNPAADDTRSALLLFITSINSGQPMESDVLTSSGTVEPDDVDVTLTTALKNPNLLDEPVLGWGSVRLTSYSIHFTRPDGKNVPGEDVPFPIVGAMTEVLETPGQNTTIGLRLVTQLAKVEPPLRNLWNNEGELMIESIAHISIFGEDLSNNAMRADGKLTIFFADFAD